MSLESLKLLVSLMMKACVSAQVILYRSMPSHSDEFARLVTKQAIARASVALGYKEAHLAVVDSLADIVRHFIEKVSRVAREVAEEHGRAQPGVQDIMYALDIIQPMNTSWSELAQFAFPEAQSTSAIAAAPSSSSSESVEEGENISVGAEEEDSKDDAAATTISAGSKVENRAAWHQPFPHFVPKFPLKQGIKADSTQVLVELEARARAPHVPSHLPPYPPLIPFRVSEGRKVPLAPSGLFPLQMRRQVATRKECKGLWKKCLFIVNEFLSSNLDSHLL